MINIFKNILNKFNIFFFNNFGRDINGCPIIENEKGWVLGRLKKSFFTMKFFPKSIIDYKLETTHK